MSLLVKNSKCINFLKCVSHYCALTTPIDYKSMGLLKLLSIFQHFLLSILHHLEQNRHHTADSSHNVIPFQGTPQNADSYIKSCFLYLTSNENMKNKLASTTHGTNMISKTIHSLTNMGSRMKNNTANSEILSSFILFSFCGLVVLQAAQAKTCQISRR